MRILIVEDDPLSRRLLESSLSRWGYEILLAGDGRQAWEILQIRDAPSLVIMDWMMPEIDGVEVCRRVRAMPNQRLVYIILLTTRDQPEDTIKGLQSGADDYVTKPFDREELRARVQVGVRIVEMHQQLAEQARQLEAEKQNVDRFRLIAMERERFEAAIRAMTDGVVVTDEDYLITDANRSACLLLNVAPGGLAGMPLLNALQPFALSVPREEIFDRFHTSAAFEIIRANTLPPLYLDANITRLLDTEGHLASAIMVLRDITAIRHVQTVQTNFFTLVSHKLRTPLTILGGYLTLCSQMPVESMGPQLERVLDVCSKETRYLADMVERLLEFKTVTTQQMEAENHPTELAPLIQSTGKALQTRYTNRPLDLDVSIGDNAAFVSISRTHFGIILDKLLDNSMKFNNKDRVHVCIQTSRPSDDYVSITISDNGPGIPYEYHDRVFSGFVQIENFVTGEVAGLGVGLRIARQIIQAYGGSIALSSELGSGAVLSFTLPACEVPTAATPIRKNPDAK